MTRTRTVVICAEKQVYWFLGAEPDKCAEADHEHQRREVHRHCDLVNLPDGTPITAVSFDAIDPYARDRDPDYGLYLDQRWQPPWPHEHLSWPDFAVPDDATATLSALQSLLAWARAGQRVEIGCLGGHGRTGTALAGLSVLAGQDPDGAVAWVRSSYCQKAVETDAQEAFVASLPR